jgi:hypothetical protein
MAKRSDENLFQLPTTQEAIQSKRDRVELEALLREAHSLSDAARRLSEVKKRIIELAQGTPGVRYNNLCAIVRYQDGKLSLDRALLVEAGVTPLQLESGTKRGEGYWVCELPKIGEGAR